MKLKLMTMSGLFCAAALSSGAAQMDPQGAYSKKFVAYGWEFAYITPQDYLDNVDEFMETPLDGVSINVLGDKEVGRGYQCFRHICMPPRWTTNQLANLVAPIRKMSEYRCFKESFIGAWQPPKKRLSWTDDEAWSVASNNLRTVAWLAREGNMPGVRFDIEDYTKQRQFFRVDGDLPYDELVKVVRQRGREIFGGIFEEYPDITLFMFWLLSDAPYRHIETNLPGLMREREDLWPAFVNGMLDVIPPGATVIDGEEDAYKFEASRRDFHALYTRIFNWDLSLVAPENRAKYRAQVSPSVGQYIDMYVPGGKSNWKFDVAPDTDMLRLFERNFRQAVSSAQKYVWFWSERGRWIRWSEALRNDRERLHGGAKLVWEDSIPGGFMDTIKAIKDPDGFLLPRLDKAIAAGELKNLMEGRKFDTWIRPVPKAETNAIRGTLTQEDGKMVGHGLEEHGCFHVTFKDVSKGDVYYFKGFVKGAKTAAQVSFKTPQGKGIYGTKALLIPGKPDADGWREYAELVTIPEVAGEFTLALGFNKQLPGESASFRDFRIYHVTGYDGWRAAADGKASGLSKKLNDHAVHRAWGLDWPHNAMVSIRKCWDAGLVPEVDARISSDGIVFALHDYKGKSDFRKIPWNELKDVDIGSAKGDRWAGEKPARWDAIFSEMSGRPERRVMMDIKTAPPETMYNLAKKYGVENQVICLSCGSASLKKWKKLVPGGETRLVPHPGSWSRAFPAEVAAEQAKERMEKSVKGFEKDGLEGIDMVKFVVRVDPSAAEPICPPAATVKKSVEKIHAMGKRAGVWVWCGGERIESYRLLSGLGFDSFGSDYPETMLKFLEESGVGR